MTMLPMLCALAAGSALRRFGAAVAPNATEPAKVKDIKANIRVCSMAAEPADLDNIADMEDMAVHNYIKAQKLVKLVSSDPKLAKLESAQAKLEDAAKAYKAAEGELMVAIDEMLETPLVDGPKLAERVAAKDKDLLVVFYAPWLPLPELRAARRGGQPGQRTAREDQQGAQRGQAPGASLRRYGGRGPGEHAGGVHPDGVPCDEGRLDPQVQRR